MNVRIDYLYRDAANNKRWGAVTFGNRCGLSGGDVRERLLDAAEPWQVWADMLHFRPEDVGLRTLYFVDAGYAENDDDLELHEVARVSTVADPADDPRDIRAFLEDVARAARSSSRS